VKKVKVEKATRQKAEVKSEKSSKLKAEREKNVGQQE